MHAEAGAGAAPRRPSLLPIVLAVIVPALLLLGLARFLGERHAAFSARLETLDALVAERALTGAEKLERVLLNLVDNAIAFNREGSAITLRVRVEDAAVLRCDVADEGEGVVEVDVGILEAAGEAGDLAAALRRFRDGESISDSDTRVDLKGAGRSSRLNFQTPMGRGL